MNVDLIKSYQVEAAHALPPGVATARVHGHSFEVDIVLSGECDPQLGWLIDYAEVTNCFEETYAALDHHFLNEVEGMTDPSIEGMRAWLRERLAELLPDFKDVHVRIRGECAFNPVRLEADSALGLPARIGFGFEAAHALPRLPETHKCYRLHGHSFLVEVAAKNLDGLIPSLKGVYDALDHRCLNDIDGLSNPTSEVVSRWIWEHLSKDHADLEAVIVAETCTARCVYHGQ